MKAAQANIFDKINNYLASLQKIKAKDRVIFYRLLAVMVNSWMTLNRSMWVLHKQEKNLVLKNMLIVFHDQLKDWKSLSECLELYPNSFPSADIGVVQSWEKTGQLNSVLVDLADQTEKVESVSWKIKGAMMYPAFVIVVVFGVVFVMMTLVVPKLLEIFDDTATLPGSTQTLIFISDMFVNYWFVIIGWIIALVLWVGLWKKTPSGAYNFDRMLLKIPIFWEIQSKLILSKFSRVFSWLISSGVSIVESLHITSQAVWNEVYAQRIILLSEDVKKWIKIWESLDGDALFPDMMVQMIQVWEQTAKLDQTITKVADFYDEQVDNTIGVINKLLEPMIIVFLAVVVGFIAIAIMQPIMNLADSISNT